MNQKELVRDLARLEEMTTDTNLLIHIARIRERAENGFYLSTKSVLPIRLLITGYSDPVTGLRIVPAWRW